MHFKLAVAAVAVALCGFAVTTPLLGAEKCSWGPSYWCSNITSAKSCKAVKHCISTIWEKQHVPEDNDSICKICTDMVKQARDQLESNETQEDIKAVFEGSCKLIPIKLVRKECIKFSDEFIPELIETLASQMNPTVVCSVAGLCNNVEIDKLLEEAAAPKEAVLAVDSKCDGCYTVIDRMRTKFDRMSYEQFLEASLRMCGKLGSFSDACATNIFTHFEDIYSHLRVNFYPESVCHVAGTCTAKFHQHPKKPESTSIEITPMGTVGRLDNEKKDDIDCDLCKQLVIHLRTILVANTTEDEFKQVLQGICKQTGTFKSECLSIVDQYYGPIYEFLVNELDPDNACFMIGLCHKNAAMLEGPIAPLMPAETAKLATTTFQEFASDRLVGNDEINSYRRVSGKNENKDKNHVNVQILDAEHSQLPRDELLLNIPKSNEVCVFCQYFLHFVQEQISDDKTEEKIKQTVEKACKSLPSSVESQCEMFVESYGDAVIALLAQEIDPATACPALALCPQKDEATIEVLMNTGSSSKSNCPLCLFAVEQLESMLKDNRTRANIQNALDHLCAYLPTKLKPECTDFVDTYSKELVEMLAVQFTPQEVCVYLKICVDNKPDLSLSLVQDTAVNDFMDTIMRNPADRNRFRKPLLPAHMLENEANGIIETNVIPDNTANGKPLVYADLETKPSTQCVLCEFIMSQIDKELKDKATDDEIKSIVHGVCNHLPKNVKNECNNFVDKYADAVIALLTQELSPKEVCTTLSMCNDQSIALKASVMECGVCRQLIDVLQQLLSNPRIDRNIEHVTEKACRVLPSNYKNKCVEIMRAYGDTIIHYITHLADSSQICTELGMCGSTKEVYVEIKSDDDTDDLLARKRRSAEQQLGAKKCTWGPSYWCENEEQAKECHALTTCQTVHWKAEKPPTKN